MMKFIKKRNQEEFTEDYDNYYDDTYYGDGQAEVGGSFDDDDAPVLDDTAAAPGVSFAGAQAPVALKLVTPKGYEDGPEIADYIVGGSTVLLNIEDLDKAVAKRLMDFLFGAIHVLGGTTKKVTRTTFVFAPGNVGVSGFGEEEEE
ncbi:MAG: cell division protein SepF [Ruminococcaceae bacterium]|nr:cell division protein SepF [Oscillospiraceae bacterium]